MSGSDLPPEESWFTFSMGEFEATFPRDRMYARNHMWAKQVSEGRWQFGLTAYAVRLLQDVYFLDWIVEPPTTVNAKDNIGSIESKKAESDLFSAVPGQLVAINDVPLSDPSIINAEPYSSGWLLEYLPDSINDLLSPGQYQDHLKDAWEVAQRTIKGQANT